MQFCTVHLRAGSLHSTLQKQSLYEDGNMIRLCMNFGFKCFIITYKLGSSFSPCYSGVKQKPALPIEINDFGSLAKSVLMNIYKTRIVTSLSITKSFIAFGSGFYCQSHRKLQWWQWENTHPRQVLCTFCGGFSSLPCLEEKFLHCILIYFSHLYVAYVSYLKRTVKLSHCFLPEIALSGCNSDFPVMIRVVRLHLLSKLSLKWYTGKQSQL